MWIDPRERGLIVWLIFSGGLEEIRVWDWARILDEIRASEAARDDTTSSSGTATTIEIQATCAHRLRADQRHGLRGSVAMRPETNSLAIDELVHTALESLDDYD